MNTRTMQVRKHVGGLTESVATMKTIPATMTALKEYMSDMASYMFAPTQEELDSLKVKLHDGREETRIPGWNGPTYLVTYCYAGAERVPFAMCSAMPDPEVTENIPKPIKNQAQDYIENFLAKMAKSYGGDRWIIHHTIDMLVSHPAFEKWTVSSVPPILDDRESYKEVEYYLDIVRYAFKLVIPKVVTVHEFQKELNAARFGKFSLQMVINGPNDYFITLERDGSYSGIALYNGN